MGHQWQRGYCVDRRGHHRIASGQRRAVPQLRGERRRDRPGTVAPLHRFGDGDGDRSVARKSVRCPDDTRAHQTSQAGGGDGAEGTSQARASASAA